jgi:hypothetical protein
MGELGINTSSSISVYDNYQNKLGEFSLSSGSSIEDLVSAIRNINPDADISISSRTTNATGTSESANTSTKMTDCGIASNTSAKIMKWDAVTGTSATVATIDVGSNTFGQFMSSISSSCDGNITGTMVNGAMQFNYTNGYYIESSGLSLSGFNASTTSVVNNSSLTSNALTYDVVTSGGTGGTGAIGGTGGTSTTVTTITTEVTSNTTTLTITTTVETTTTNVPNINGKALVMSLQGVHKTVKKIPADTVIVSVGYTSDQTLYEAIKDEHVHLLGDAEHPGNLMTAIWGAYTAALHI